MREKEMKEKKQYLIIAFFALLLMLCLVPSQSVDAANPTKKTLKLDKTYKSYDITGDQKADTIKIKTKQDEYGCISKVSIVINGKTLYTYKENVLYPDAELYTLKNGMPYLHFCVTMDGPYSDVDVLFQYKSGKLKKVIDLCKIEKKFGTPQPDTKISVSGNTVKVKFSVNSYTTSQTTFTYKYKYKNGSLKRTSNKTSTFSLNMGRGKKKFTTNKKLTVYSSPTSKKTKTLAKGTKLKITQIYQKGSQMYMKYKTTKTKKTGWIKCYKKYHSKDMFKNMYWAG